MWVIWVDGRLFKMCICLDSIQMSDAFWGSDFYVCLAGYLL